MTKSRLSLSQYVLFFLLLSCGKLYFHSIQSISVVVKLYMFRVYAHDNTNQKANAVIDIIQTLRYFYACQTKEISLKQNFMYLFMSKNSTPT